MNEDAFWKLACERLFGFTEEDKQRARTMASFRLVGNRWLPETEMPVIATAGEPVRVTTAATCLDKLSGMARRMEFLCASLEERLAPFSSSITHAPPATAAKSAPIPPYFQALEDVHTSLDQSYERLNAILNALEL